MSKARILTNFAAVLIMGVAGGTAMYAEQSSAGDIAVVPSSDLPTIEWLSEAAPYFSVVENDSAAGLRIRMDAVKYLKQAEYRPASLVSGDVGGASSDTRPVAGMCGHAGCHGYGKEFLYIPQRSDTTESGVRATSSHVGSPISP